MSAVEVSAVEVSAVEVSALVTFLTNNIKAPQSGKLWKRNSNKLWNDAIGHFAEMVSFLSIQ